MEKFRKKPLLLLHCFGYVDVAHQVVQRIKALSFKHFKMVQVEQAYVKQILCVAEEQFRVANDLHFTKFIAKTNLSYCLVTLVVEFRYIRRFLQLSTEMPASCKYSLMIQGDDLEGQLSNALLVYGLKNCPNLEAISMLNVAFDKTPTLFINQIALNSSIKRLKVLMPIFSASIYRQACQAIQLNESIEELTMMNSLPGAGSRRPHI